MLSDFIDRLAATEAPLNLSWWWFAAFLGLVVLAFVGAVLLSHRDFITRDRQYWSSAYRSGRVTGDGGIPKILAVLANWGEHTSGVHVWVQVAPDPRMPAKRNAWAAREFAGYSSAGRTALGFTSMRVHYAWRWRWLSRVFVGRNVPTYHVVLQDQPEAWRVLAHELARHVYPHSVGQGWEHETRGADGPKVIENSVADGLEAKLLKVQQ